MQNAVKQIIKAIKRDRAFDSHFVISQIIKDHSDAYIHFAGKFAGQNEPTKTMHREIAKMIPASFPSGSVKQLPQKSWSNNIHGKANECTLWVRK